MSACWCDHIDPVAIRAQLVLLQHPRESRNPIGTARMAHLSLPGSRLVIGVDFDRDPSVQALRADTSRRHVVLYPSPDARDVRELADETRPLCVWAIDGTWSQARKLYNANRWLHPLPKYRIAPQEPSQYRIREEPAPHCLSTVEAVANIVKVLHGDDSQRVLKPFFAMVDKQLSFITSGKTTRHARKPRLPKTPKAPPALIENLERMVIVHGEGNGWPARLQDTDRVEMMQWLACRPSTGERFHAFVRPRTRAPGILDHLSLAEADLVDAVTREEFGEKWKAFIRDDDALCSWGFFPIKLMEKAGFLRGARHVNLQVIGNGFAGEKLGSVDKALDVLVPGHALTPVYKGRGGRRLAAMEAIVGTLSALPRG